MTGSGWTPRGSVTAECARRGQAAVIRGCADLLAGRAADEELIVALAGPAAAHVLAGGEGGPGGYWPRVWAGRGLLHAWSDRDASADVIAALTGAASDESWRVREMAAKVIARHRVDDGLEAVTALRADPVPRVRAAAERALAALTAVGR